MPANAETVTVTVNAFGSLRETYLGGAEDVRLTLPAGARVSDVRSHFGMVAADAWLTAVNDLALLSDEDPALREDDLIEFFLPVSGG